MSFYTSNNSNFPLSPAFQLQTNDRQGRTSSYAPRSGRNFDSLDEFPSDLYRMPTTPPSSPPPRSVNPRVLLSPPHLPSTTIPPRPRTPPRKEPSAFLKDAYSSNAFLVGKLTPEGMCNRMRAVQLASPPRAHGGVLGGRIFHAAPLPVLSAAQLARKARKERARVEAEVRAELEAAVDAAERAQTVRHAGEAEGARMRVAASLQRDLEEAVDVAEDEGYQRECARVEAEARRERRERRAIAREAERIRAEKEALVREAARRKEARANVQGKGKTRPAAATADDKDETFSRPKLSGKHPMLRPCTTARQ